jgi:hypothetical protein
MDPARLVPTPDTIPVAWGWFQALLTFTFVLHILFMNTLLGSAILALFREFRTSPAPDPVSRDISLKLPYTLAFTVNLGVAPLLFVQVLYGQFIYTSSILMAVYWLGVVFLLIPAYYSAYLYGFTFDGPGRARRVFIAICTFLLLAVAFLFTNNMTLMLSPPSWTRYFSNPWGTLLNLSDPILVPRYLHFVTASLAVGGLFQALVWDRRQRRGTPGAEAHRDFGLRVFIRSTLLQAGFGLWLLLTLPPGTRDLFLGKGILQTSVLILAVAGAGLALVLAAGGKVRQTALALVATVGLMAVAREFVRASFLKPYFSPSDLTVVPEYGPMVLFLVSLAAGLALVVYMLRLAAACRKEVAP